MVETMFLMRVQLPDVPGSLGRLATAIGAGGGDIEAFEIVDKRVDGTAVDDVLLDTVPGAMPDSIVSACNALEGVQVLWIGRYLAGGNLFMDLEVVEALTADPETALDRLVDLLPVTFRCEWAARVDGTTVLSRTEGAPTTIEVARVDDVERRTADDDLLVLAPLGDGQTVVIGRRGGPEFLDSELARFGHLVNLAASIRQRSLD
jgi:hypothetical protein